MEPRASRDSRPFAGRGEEFAIARLEDRWAAYAAAELRLQTPDGCVRVRPARPGQTAGTFPGAADGAIYVVTAYNPGGQVSDEAANKCAQARLEDELRREKAVTWPAWGGDRAWRHVEPSVAVLGIDMSRALALGRAYRQEAIFALTPAALRVVECQGTRQVTNGWVIEAWRDRPGDASW